MSLILSFIREFFPQWQQDLLLIAGVFMACGAFIYGCLALSRLVDWAFYRRKA